MISLVKIRELIEKSEFKDDKKLVRFMKSSFSEIEKMTFSFLKSDFKTRSGSDLIIKEKLISLDEISRINSSKEEDLLSEEEKKVLIENNCSLKEKKVVCKKVS